MAVQPVGDDNNISKARAQQRLRSGEATPAEKAQYAVLFGEDFVKQALGHTSADINEVKIDDVSYDAAKNAGKQAAKDSTGYDGSTSHTSITGAIPSVVGAASSIGTLAGVGFLKTTTLNSAVWGSQGATTGFGSKSLGMYVAAALAIATAAKYWLENPNKEQVDATQNILNSELPQAQSALYTAQSDMADATAETTALAEEAEEANEDAAEKIEEDKTLFDFYREQFLALKQKAESGEKLTPDEKELMKQLAPVMEELGSGITETGDETSETVGDLFDEIEEYQEAYDNSAETIAEVEGVTDFAEGFDETTRTMCYVEAGSQTLNAASGGWAGAKLCASGFWNWALGIASIAAGASSAIAATQQMTYASKVSNEIDVRRETQEIGTQTNDLYNEELENFLGNMEVTEDLELEMPDDLEVPEEPVVTDEGESPVDPLMAAASGANPSGNGNGNGNAGGANNGNSGLGLFAPNNNAGGANNAGGNTGLGLFAPNNNAGGANNAGNTRAGFGNENTGLGLNAPNNNAGGANNSGNENSGVETDSNVKKNKDKK